MPTVSLSMVPLCIGALAGLGLLILNIVTIISSHL
jgi:hypothetical protein